MVHVVARRPTLVADRPRIVRGVAARGEDFHAERAGEKLPRAREEMLPARGDLAQSYPLQTLLLDVAADGQEHGGEADRGVRGELLQVVRDGRHLYVAGDGQDPAT